MTDKQNSYTAAAVGVGSTVGACAGYLGKVAFSDATSCPIGIDDYQITFTVIPVITFFAAMIFTAVIWIVLDRCSSLSIFLARRLRGREFALYFAALCFAILIGWLLYSNNCKHLSYEPLHQVASIRVDNSSSEASATLRDPKQVAKVVDFMNSRTQHWVQPAPGYGMVGLTFFDDRRRVLAAMSFDLGGVLRQNGNAAESLYFRPQDAEDDALTLCTALGQPLATEMCGGPEMFGSKMQYPVNQELVRSCAASPRSSDPQRDPCARLVFAAGHFTRPIVTFWQSTRQESNNYMAKFPGFELDDFCGSIMRLRDGSLRLEPESDRRRCSKPCHCSVGTTFAEDAKNSFRKYGYSIEPDSSNSMASSIEVPAGGSLPAGLLLQRSNHRPRERPKTL